MSNLENGINGMSLKNGEQSLTAGSGYIAGDQGQSSSNVAELKELKQTIFDILRDVRDPEKPETLEELNVLTEESISVTRLKGNQLMVNVEFTPTVPHCSLASLIGLTIRSKLQQCLPEIAKVDINIKEGTHTTADEINKQINDKERIAAAMENPNLRELVKACTSDVEDTY
ncbi:hypothetical protein SNE40_004727 [Patella caerulea]|uniref:MIP18 family-like domain-containing protein n=1 Tax=Patella caerulea TaxID=87958 RepID=A0AAN8KA70_PATCE